MILFRVLDRLLAPARTVVLAECIRTIGTGGLDDGVVLAVMRRGADELVVVLVAFNHAVTSTVL